jgi:DNA repair photolyase
MKQQANSCSECENPTPESGAREWSENSFNIGQGRLHGCLYGYARHNALRVERIASMEGWADERLRPNQPVIKKYKGVVMFPTTYDITPFCLDPALKALRGLLEHGNRVLIVSKPNFARIERLCRELGAFKPQVLFRFSIGSLDESQASLWEPGAPAIAERRRCLVWARSQGYDASVSLEPMSAGAYDAIATFQALESELTEKVWIGIMNRVSRRVRQVTAEIRAACGRIQQLQSDQETLRLVRTLDGRPKVEWKDSIKAVIAAHPGFQAGQDRRGHTRDGWGSPSRIEVSHPTELKSGQ